MVFNMPRLLLLLAASVSLISAVVLITPGLRASANQPAAVGPDGLDDLFFYANSGPNQTLLNNGDGSFNAGVVAGASPNWRVYSGRFTNDDLDDILFYNYSDGTAIIIAALGDGGYTQEPTANWETNLYITLGDFNGDGLTDVLKTKSDSSFSVVEFATGNGTWTHPGGDTGDGHHDSLTVGDFNGDTKDDFAVSIEVPTNRHLAFVKLADGAGGWTDEEFPIDDAAALDAGDFNGDGLSDLLVYYRGSKVDYQIYMRNPQGIGFDPSSHLEEHDFYSFPVIGDFTGDGRDDVIIDENCYCDSEVTAHLYQISDTGAFQEVGDPFDLPQGNLLVGRFDGNTTEDFFLFGGHLVGGGSGGAQPGLWLSNGDGTWDTFPMPGYGKKDWTYALPGDFGTSPTAVTPTPTASPSPSPTPTPSPTNSATPSPTHSATPSPTLSPQRIQGDVTCDGSVTIDDAAALLAHVATHSGPPTGCLTAPAAVFPLGDTNCDGSVTAIDVLEILRATLELPEIALPQFCPEVGQPLTS
jgi:hypothetical protein